MKGHYLLILLGLIGITVGLVYILHNHFSNGQLSSILFPNNWQPVSP